MKNMNIVQQKVGINSSSLKTTSGSRSQWRLNSPGNTGCKEGIHTGYDATHSLTHTHTKFGRLENTGEPRRNPQRQHAKFHMDTVEK